MILRVYAAAWTRQLYEQIAGRRDSASDGCSTGPAATCRGAAGLRPATVGVTPRTSRLITSAANSAPAPPRCWPCTPNRLLFVAERSRTNSTSPPSITVASAQSWSRGCRCWRARRHPVDEGREGLDPRRGQNCAPLGVATAAEDDPHPVRRRPRRGLAPIGVVPVGEETIGSSSATPSSDSNSYTTTFSHASPPMVSMLRVD